MTVAKLILSNCSPIAVGPFSERLSRMPELAVSTQRKSRILGDATDRRGRYGAAKLAELLEWPVSDIAKYLGRARSSESRVHQEKLAALTAIVEDVFELTNGDLRATRAWFRMPLGTLDGITPREEILRGNLWRVRNLVDEMHSGLAF